MPRYVNPGRNVTIIDMGSPTRKLVRVTPVGQPSREGDYGAIEMTEVKALNFTRTGILRKLNGTEVVHGPVYDHTTAAKAAEEAISRVPRLRRG